MDISKFILMFTWVLVFVGALNWGLIGAFDFNLVSTLFANAMFEKITYILVGLSALYQGGKHYELF